MSIQNDYLELYHAFDELEQFNLWDPKEALTLSYILDRLYPTSRYESKIKQWKELAEDGQFNDLAWDLVQTEQELAQADPSISEKAKDYINRWASSSEKDYRNDELGQFGYVNKENAPDWFWVLYGAFTPLEEMKYETSIVKCCMEQGAMDHAQAEEIFQGISKHYDLYRELYFYSKNGRLRTWYPAHAKRQTAQDIIDRTGLSPIGAYRYMLYLKHQPEEALAKLEKGLVLKSHWEWE